QKGEPAELTQGKQIRDYMDVSDAGKKIAEAALGNQIGPLNICSGIPVTVRQLAEQIADEYGYRNLLRFGIVPERSNEPLCIVGNI
ncbi:MAG: NAD(P)-dependent oxidoreductase, partial [Haliscomenobacter sp.]